MPSDVQDQFKVIAEFRGNSVNIINTQAPWSETMGPEWTSSRVAKLTRDPATGDWYLHAINSNDRLLRYTDEMGVGPSLVEVLDEIDEDPTCLFWG